MTSIAFQPNDSSFLFGDHRIRLVRDFTTEAGTVEEIGFVATDLAKALEIANASQMAGRLDPDQKGVCQTETPGGTQSLTVVSESGFYDVVVRSDKPQGKALRAVVTREILPAIRKTGRYAPAAAAPAALPVKAMLSALERAARLMERFGGLDERDQLLFRDMTRNTMLLASGGIALPSAATQEMAISDAWLEITGQAMPRSLGPAIGRMVANLYRQDHDGAEPPKRLQYVDSAPRQVNSYERGWLLGAIERVHACGDL